MTYYVDDGNIVFQSAKNLVVDTIKPGTYSLDFDPEKIPGGYFLKRIENFSLPSKVYGNTDKHSDIILNTFLNNTHKATSAAFSGAKGSGKSLISKQICIKALEYDIPTIIIADDFAGPSLNSWVQSINQPVIIFIDEFEKVYYKEHERNQLLTLLDGAYSSHVLYLLTMNKLLNDEEFPYFFNRPGRVYYNIQFNGIDVDLIKEYCNDHLKDKSKFKEIISYSNRFKVFTLDILTILVKELNNNSNMSCKDVSEIVNIKPDIGAKSLFFNVKAFHIDSNNTRIPLEVVWNEEGLHKNAIYIPYDFANRFLTGDTTRFILPIYDQEIVEETKSKIQSAGTYHNYGYCEISIDKEEYDLTDFDSRKEYQENLQKRIKEGKWLGKATYKLSINECNHITHYQDEDSRDIIIRHKDLNVEIILSVEGRAKEILTYSF